MIPHCTPVRLAITIGLLPIICGCHSLRSHSRGIHPNRGPQNDGGRPVAIAAWDPAGMVVTSERAAQAGLATGQVVVPLRSVSLDGSRASLRDALHAAYDLERLRSLAAAELEIAVVWRRGLDEELIPLPLVLRHAPGTWIVQSGDSVGLIEWRAADVEFSSEFDDADENFSHHVSLRGFVEVPGEHKISNPRLQAIAGDPELPGGRFLQRDNGELWADLLVIQRAGPAGPRRIYLPNEMASTFFPLESERFWRQFAEVSLRDGDIVVAIPSRLALTRD